MFNDDGGPVSAANISTKSPSGYDLTQTAFQVFDEQHLPDPYGHSQPSSTPAVDFGIPAYGVSSPTNKGASINGSRQQPQKQTQFSPPDESRGQANYDFHMREATAQGAGDAHDGPPKHECRGSDFPPDGNRGWLELPSWEKFDAHNAPPNHERRGSDSPFLLPLPGSPRAWTTLERPSWENLVRQVVGSVSTPLDLARGSRRSSLQLHNTHSQAPLFLSPDAGWRPSKSSDAAARPSDGGSGNDSMRGGGWGDQFLFPVDGTPLSIRRHRQSGGSARSEHGHTLGGGAVGWSAASRQRPGPYPTPRKEAEAPREHTPVSLTTLENAPGLQTLSTTQGMLGVDPTPTRENVSGNGQHFHEASLPSVKAYEGGMYADPVHPVYDRHRGHLLESALVPQGQGRTIHNADDLQSYGEAVLARKVPELVLPVSKPVRRSVAMTGSVGGPSASPLARGIPPRPTFWSAGLDDGPTLNAIAPHIQNAQSMEHHGEPDIHGVCQRLADLLHENRESYTTFLAWRGAAAQELLDLLQNLLDSDLNLLPPMRRRLFKALIRLSHDSRLHPRCYTLTGLEQGQHVAGGSFSDVHKGLLEGQYVAVKMMRVFEGSDIEALLKEFGREALIWRQLCHPNLLPFFGLYYFQHRLCLVSPWMESGHIRAFLKRETCDTNRRLSFILDVALGLEHLHQQNVVHGDLKADNIFVTPSCRACIADFGLSSIVTSESSMLSESSKHSHGGTTRYQAPELLRGSRNNPCSDIYGFACVAYEMLTGKAPFSDLRMDGAVAAAVLEGCRPSRPQCCSGSPSMDGLWDLLQSCWDQQPAKRPTASELVKRLMGPNIQATKVQSATDWNERFTSRFRRHFLGQWYLPSVAELERIFGRQSGYDRCNTQFARMKR